MLWFPIFQIFILYLLAVVVQSFIHSKSWAKILSVLFGGAILLQIISVYLSSSLIDYRFVEHFNFRDITLSASFYIPQLILAVFIWFVLSFGMFKLGRMICKQDAFNSRIKLLGALGMLALLFLPNGIIPTLYKVASLKSTNSESFLDALSKLGISKEEYLSHDEISAKAGKNVIILSLESFERSLLNENLSHLTPELNKLAKAYSFFPMQEMAGSDWTQGSLYTFLTGVPFFFGGNRERVFEQAEETKINTLPLVFDKAGYEQLYIMGKPEFSATDKLLNILGIDILSEKNTANKYEKTPWGLRDKDLFTELKKASTNLSQKNKPFVLYASTVSTHWPDGVYDERMEAFIEPQKSELAFSIKSLDYLIGDFMNYLKEAGILEHTVVYIFPDHQYMQTLSHADLSFEDPKGLYLISTAELQTVKTDSEKPLFQIDLPRLFLQGAGIQHNARFLSDFIKADKKLFLESNQNNILRFNEAALIDPTFEGDLSLSLTENGELVLKNATHEQIIEGIGNEGTFAVNIVFDEKMRISLEQATVQEAFVNPPLSKHIFVSKKAGIISAYLRSGKDVFAFRQGSGPLHFLESERAEMDASNLYKEKIFQHYPARFKHSPLHPNSLVEIISSSHEVPARFRKSQITAGERVFRLSPGITLLTLKNEAYQIKRYDTFTDAPTAKAFIQDIEKLIKQAQFFSLIVDVSVGNQLRAFEKSLKKLGLYKLASLTENQAYIAYSDKGFVLEETDNRFLAFSFPHFGVPIKRTKNELTTQSKTPARFIAHGGGAIDGEIYTNSLEALNHNYQKGFRYFELDIIKTADGQYVAAHDWEVWKAQTGYEGKVPVSLEVFKKHLIKERFHSLDMEAINTWFAQHPDAILVTDKVNDPKDFVSQFMDKKRLMMELFSLEALEAGAQLGIRSAMPSMNVLNAIAGDKIAYLKGLGVKDVAVSLDLLYRDLSFFQQLKAHGIRTYLFHINRYPWMDETHALLFEMDYVYGIYADEWTF